MVQVQGEQELQLVQVKPPPFTLSPAQVLQRPEEELWSDAFGRT